MKVIEKKVKGEGRTDEWRVYTIGDAHIGKINTCEQAVIRVVDRIKHDDHALWVGGGDLLDCIKPSDVKRWDPACMPDWMFEGSALDIRERMRDVVKCQVDRAVSILDPIKDKCVGLLEGNHEYSIRKHCNCDVQRELCGALGTTDLTDCAFVEFLFRRLAGHGGNRVVGFFTHGHGGGRTAGAEPNHLARMLLDKDCDFAARGHSHTFHILPPVISLTVKQGRCGNEGRIGQRVRRAYNWGCYVLSYPEGPSTYETRACYPARPLTTACVAIRPFRQTSRVINGTKRDIDYVETRIEEINLWAGE